MNVRHYQILKLVSNCIKFSSMFRGCRLLSDIKPLEKWNVSNCNNFKSMFYGCSFSNVKTIEKLNVSNKKFFDDMLNFI